MTADLTTRIAELTAAIEARLKEDWQHAYGLSYACMLPGRKPDFTFCGGPAAEAYWEHFTPHRQMDHVTATRALVAAILALPHQWWTCALAVPPDTPDDHCTCGRDEHVASLLGIIASEWEEQQ